MGKLALFCTVKPKTNHYHHFTLLLQIFGVCGLKPPAPKGRSPSELATKNFSSAATKTTTVSTTSESKHQSPVANGNKNDSSASNGTTTEAAANGNALPS